MPSIVAPGTPFSRKIIAIAGIALLLLALAGVLVGMQSTSVGAEGLRNHGILGIGFACLGASVFLFGIVLASDAWSRRPRGKEAILEYLTTFLAETGKLGVTILIYGGGAIIALGSLSSFDRADSAFDVVFRLIIMIACIAVIVAWRRRNKKHPRSYNTVGPIGLVAFMAALCVLGVLGGAMVISEYASDRANGPQTVLCRLSDVEENRPSGRYRALSPTKLEIEFTSYENESIHQVAISEHDREALKEIIDSGGICYLTYYPASKIFVSAKPV